MKVFFSVAMLAVLSSSAQAVEVPGAEIGAGGSASFPSYYKDLSSSDVTGDRVREILSKEGSRFDLGFANFELHAPMPLRPEGSWPAHFSFGLGAEAAGSVLAPGSTSNEIRASRIVTGHARGLFDGNLAEDFYFGLGLIGGGGNEKQEEYVNTGATTLAPSSRQSTVLYGGVDAKIQKTWRFRDASRLVNTLETQETFFKAMNTNNAGAVDWSLPNSSHDWRFRNDYMISHFDLNLIFGKHPYPTDLLPRVWNRIQDGGTRGLKPMFGAGGGASFGMGRDVKGAFLAGYYAGALGGEFRVRVPNALEARLSTYEVVDSGALQDFYQRSFAFTLAIDL